jgi:recombination protein RecA
MPTKKKLKASDIKKTTKEPADKIQMTPNKGDFEQVISTGSTLLDLNISGGRIRGGGIPGGILLEIYGPSSSGKSALLSEMGADTQLKGGDMQFLDPEGRLDKNYARIYGINIDKENYNMPNTVTEVMDFIYNWEPTQAQKVIKKMGGKTAINMIGCDSIAALCSRMQMDGTDKRGQAAAKEFSQGLRKVCKIIRDNLWIIAFTNQVRQGDTGEATPGGMAVPFYASLRLRIGPPAQDKYIKKEATIRGTKSQRILGVKSIVTVKKSSVDDPYRTCPVYIVFGYGIDDIRGNLVYCKQYMGTSGYDVFGDKEYRRMDLAIQHIEENNLQDKLKERTIDLWYEVQEKLSVSRSPKKR